MSNNQTRIDLAIASFEADAVAYENIANECEAREPFRASACREMAAIIRSWKDRPDSVNRRIRAKGF